MDNLSPSVNTQQLYRLYDADGELLYIGVSYSAITRFAAHKEDKPWIGCVARIDIETHHTDRAGILEIERQAIIAERPKWNKVHNGGSLPARPPTPAGFRCRSCANPAKYVQATWDGEWQAVCATHDTLPDPRYWFQASRCTGDDAPDRWYDHLKNRQWFDSESFDRMIDLCWSPR